MLRVGLIGLGVMGKNHLRVLSSTEGIELVAVIDPQDPTLLGEVSIPVYSRIEEISTLTLNTGGTFPIHLPS